MDQLPAQQSSPRSPSLTQQFCLRWHNHQTSLLTSLPLLLDQSHLTDVTLSAEGRTVRAHRIVLSACSSFFSELFRTLDLPFHPVIVIPGASFGSIVALLTFMYSGEVNVFEEQISTLLSLAETLGIKGLADVNSNVAKNSSLDDSPSVLKQSQAPTPVPKTPSPPSPPLVNSPLATSSAQFSLPLENMLAKTFQLCPSMLGNPLNFSSSAISRGAEIFSRYQTQCRLNQLEQKNQETTIFDENGNSKNFMNIEAKGRKTKITDTRKVDKIAENLRSSNNRSSTVEHQEHLNKHPLMTQSLTLPLALPLKSAMNFRGMQQGFDGSPMSMETKDLKSPMDFMSLNDPVSSNPNAMKKSLVAAANACGLTQKSTNSKLYATCFICHKQLSNQYNLRVHLETHQNVRYACSVCSHVSRSKDALRKHVSYRHPGTASPSETESKRKRSRGPTSVAVMQSQIQQQQQQQQQHQKSDHLINSPSFSSPASVSSPIIKNEINDLTVASASPLSLPTSHVLMHQPMLEQIQSSSYGHSEILIHPLNDGNTSTPQPSPQSACPSPRTSATCLLVRPVKDTS